MARNRIFISYRRDDSSGQAGRLYDALAEKYGRNNVFMDIDTIAAGEDFVQAIDLALKGSDVVLVLMGPGWSGPQADGTRRIDNQNDFVRLEVERALKKGCRVIPVMVRDARPPKPSDLPASMEELSRRNAIELSETRWHDDVRRLRAALDDRTPDGPGAEARARSAWSVPPARSTQGIAIGVVGLVLIAVLGLVVLNVLGSRGGGNPSPTSPIARGSTAPPGSVDLYASLLAGVPEAFRSSCHPSIDPKAGLFEGAIAETRCMPLGAPITYVQYFLLPSVDALRNGWQGRMIALQSSSPTSSGNCFQGTAGQIQHQKGNLQCGIEGGKARIRWTDTNTLEYGVLQAVDSNIANAVAWWGANAVEGGTGS